MAMFFLADRFLKNLAILKKSDDIIALVPNHLYFSFHANENIAFSLPLGNQLALIISIILIILLSFFLCYIYQKKYSPIIIFSFLFMILGAISNVFDRLQYSFVIDYLYVPWFTVFNIADVMISLSAIFIIFIILFKNK